MIKKDNLYYWNHPEEYKRLTADDLKEEATITLYEIMLQGLRDEIEELIKGLKRTPKDQDLITKAQIMKRNLEDPFIEAITFGHGRELITEFVNRCPDGVFGANDYRRPIEKQTRRRRYYLKANGAGIGNKRNAVGPY